MSYLYKKHNESRFDKREILTVLIIIFFIVFKTTSVGDYISQILLPVFKIGDSSYKVVPGISESFWSKEKLLQELQVLREKERELNLKLTDIVALQFENRELRNALKVKPEQAFITSFVVARPPQTSFDTLLIDVGKNSSVNVGDSVLVSPNTMIGKVIETKLDSSIVLLNSSSLLYFSAQIARNSVPLEVFGHGSGNLFSKVPIITDIEIGDVIVSNYGNIFSIGVVREIIEDEASGFKDIFIALPANISNINLVFILPQNSSPN